MSVTYLSHRYLARLVIETASAMRIGTGNKGISIDNLVVKDANGLPYLPGTSLVGVMRHEFEAHSSMQTTDSINQLFGFQAEEGEDGLGSRIIVTDAMLVAEDGKHIHEGLEEVSFDSNPYYQSFQKLPERDHVRINDKGTAVDQAKYLEEVIPKGTRFAFELELQGTEGDQDDWNNLLGLLHQSTFRIGAGTRKGLGKFEIIECKCQTFHLTDRQELIAYLEKPSSLNYDTSTWQAFVGQTLMNENWITYQVELTPQDFFLFGAGTGDRKVDATFKTEQFFEWNEQGAKLTTQFKHLLIPATSLKGAIAHRVAFYYNKFEQESLLQNFTFQPELAIEEIDFGVKADLSGCPETSDEVGELMRQIEAMDLHASASWTAFDEQMKSFAETDDSQRVGENNQAIRQLFGYSNSESDGKRGNVLLDDLYEKDYAEKIFNHVAINRFTGGGRDSALFNERTSALKKKLVFEINVRRDAFSEDEITIQKAFDRALLDLVDGHLPLGGSTMKGHGIFKGQFKKLTQ